MWCQICIVNHGLPLYTKDVHVRRCDYVSSISVWRYSRIYWTFTSTTDVYLPKYCDYYNDVIMGAIASQIISLTIVYSTVCSDADQRKHQSSALLVIRAGNSPGEFPAQMTNNAENVSILWRHHDNVRYLMCCVEHYCLITNAQNIDSSNNFFKKSNVFVDNTRGCWWDGTVRLTNTSRQSSPSLASAYAWPGTSKPRCAFLIVVFSSHKLSLRFKLKSIKHGC